MDARDSNGTSPLYASCHNGHMGVVRALLAAGAKVDLQDNDGCTALYIACQNGHVNVVQTLLSAGAQANLQRNTGASPLYAGETTRHQPFLCVGGHFN